MPDLKDVPTESLKAELRRRGPQNFRGRFEFLTRKMEHHDNFYGFRVKDLESGEELILNPGAATKAVIRMLDKTEWTKLEITTEPKEEGTLCTVCRIEENK